MASVNVCIDHCRHKSNNINTGLLFFDTVCIKMFLSVITSDLFISKSENLCLFLILGEYFVISTHLHCDRDLWLTQCHLLLPFWWFPFLVSYYWCLFLCLYLSNASSSCHICQTTFSISNLMGYLGRESCIITSNICINILRRTPLINFYMKLIFFFVALINIFFLEPIFLWKHEKERLKRVEISLLMAKRQKILFFDGHGCFQNSA